MERINENYEAVNQLLESAGLEPDAGRHDWEEQRPQVDRLLSHYAQLAEASTSIIDDFGEDIVGQLRENVSATAGEVIAVLSASGKSGGARDLLRKTITESPEGDAKVELQAAERDMDSFMALNYGRWLVRRGQRKAAAVVLQPIVDRARDEDLRFAAQQVLDAPKPLTSAPSLFSFYGFGLGMSGSRDHRGDSHVSNHCLTALFIPVVPVSAYRVVDHGDGGYTFLNKEKLSDTATWWRRGVLATLVLVVAYFGINAYLNNPDRLARKAADKAAATAKTGDVKNALIAYDKVLADYSSDASASVLGKVGAEIMELHAVGVNSPLTVDRVASAERVIRRLDALHHKAQSSQAREVVARHALAWARQLGTDSIEKMESASRLLETALPVAGAGAPQLSKHLRQVKLSLAAHLAPDWPLSAVGVYLETSGGGAMTKAGALLEKIAANRSLLLAADLQAKAWIAASGVRSELAEAKTRLNTAISQARVYSLDEARRTALAKPNEKTVRALLANAPKDQNLVASLAALRMQAGNAHEAVKLLAELGKPGWMIPQAQELLAQAYSRSGQVERADALLSKLVMIGLPRYLVASRKYNAAASAFHKRHVEQAQRGAAPAHVNRALDAQDQRKGVDAFNRWVSKRMAADLGLSALKKTYTAYAHVVSLSLSLGTIKLQRANKVSGPARAKLLAGAERTFLAIRQDAAGLPSYHLGLGQVYHRLGKSKEGDKELNGLLKRNDPAISLAVCRTYRELGMVGRAKSIAEKIYSTGKAPHHHEAAMIRAIMEHDLDKRESWLLKANQEAPFVRTTLLELRARKLYRDGHYKRADEAMARAAKRNETAAKHSAVAANNAAIAYQFRYSCTGNKQHLRRAIDLLESSLRLTPDAALVVANLAELRARVGVLDVLRGLLRIDVLRSPEGSATNVLVRLKDGSRWAALSAQLRGNSSLNRSERLLRQQQVLRPTDASSFGSLAARYWMLGDEPKLQQLLQALRARKVPFEQADPKERAAYFAGKRDAKLIAEANNSVTKASHTVGRAKRSDHKPTLAVALLRLADAQLHHGQLSGQLPLINQSINGYLRAHALWPALGADETAAWAMVAAAVQATVVESPTFKVRWERERRRYGLPMFIHRLLGDASAADLVAELRKQKDLTRAANRLLAVKGPVTAKLWILGRLANDKQLIERGLNGFTRKSVRHMAEISVLLRPASDDAKAMFELYKQHP